MQGDPLDDPVILDQVEISATISTLQALKANFLQYCAYNIELAPYTGANLQARLSQGSSFLALRTNGAANLTAARTAWLAAVSNLNTAIYRLEHRTGSPNQHFIKIDTHNGVSQANIDSMKFYLPKIQRALETSEHFTLNTDGNDNTPNIDIVISLNAIFTHPVTDLKTLFPAYTVTLDTGVTTDNMWRNDSISASVTVSQQTSVHWSRSADYANGVRSNYFSDATVSIPEFDAFWNTNEQQYRNNPHAHLSMNCNQFFSNSGTYQVRAYLYCDYEQVTHRRFQPVITWNAQNFSQWVLPNPSFNGLFPGITTDAQFKSTFGIADSSWSRTKIMELWR